MKFKVTVIDTRETTYESEAENKEEAETHAIVVHTGGYVTGTYKIFGPETTEPTRIVEEA